LILKYLQINFLHEPARGARLIKTIPGFTLRADCIHRISIPMKLSTPVTSGILHFDPGTITCNFQAGQVLELQITGFF